MSSDSELIHAAPNRAIGIPTSDGNTDASKYIFVLSHRFLCRSVSAWQLNERSARCHGSGLSERGFRRNGSPLSLTSRLTRRPPVSAPLLLQPLLPRPQPQRPIHPHSR